MIYSSRGIPITIVAYCGSYATVEGTVRLVKAQPVNDNVFTFYFAERLQGDINEIILAIAQAPRQRLNKSQLEQALEIAK